MVSTRALETAYLHQFWTSLVLGCLGPFWAVLVSEKYPLGPFGPGMAAVGTGGTETGETGLETGTVGTGTGLETGDVKTGSNRTEPGPPCSFQLTGTV